MPIVSRLPNTQVHTSSVRSLTWKNSHTMSRPARPYAPSTSPIQSSAACTNPNASSSQFRFCSSLRAASSDVPEDTCRL